MWRAELARIASGGRVTTSLYRAISRARADRNEWCSSHAAIAGVREALRDLSRAIKDMSG